MATLQQLRDSADDPRLQTFIGKQVLVGLWQFYEGELVEQSQDLGYVAAITDGYLVLQTPAGKRYFPVQYEALRPAPRGKYVLKTTGEEVVNPDFLLSWRLNLADKLEESDWRANLAPHFASIVGEEWDYEGVIDWAYLKTLIAARAEEFIGKTVIIGLRKYQEQEDGSRQRTEQLQLYGQIIRVNLSEGVVIGLKDGSEYKLPPDISMFQPAPPGEYTFTSTGEVIVNPDLMTMWTATAPQQAKPLDPQVTAPPRPSDNDRS